MESAHPANALVAPPSDHVAPTFLDSLARARHETVPFDYWLLEGALPAGDVEAILRLPIAPPKDAILNGKRETNNQTRVFFTRENQETFAVFQRIAEGFNDGRVRGMIKQTTGTFRRSAARRIGWSGLLA
jgi:hypothetical protein